MPVTWRDTEAIAQALYAAHPEAAPLGVPSEALRAWVAALPGLNAAGAAAGREELSAIRMLWYELSQEDQSDVSG